METLARVHSGAAAVDQLLRTLAIFRCYMWEDLFLSSVAVEMLWRPENRNVGNQALIQANYLENYGAARIATRLSVVPSTVRPVGCPASKVSWLHKR